MRILVVHNLYRSSVPSGENTLVQAEVRLLQQAGLEVYSHFEDSDTIVGMTGHTSAAMGPVYSPAGVRRFRTALRAVAPDVVHFHNVLPLVSPASVRVAGKLGPAVVHTVHNYRHSCVNGLHFRDGRNCTDCLGSRVNFPAVRHGCYRDSRLQTLPMAIGLAVHRATWRKNVDAMICLTPFMSVQLQAIGIDPDRLYVRPTWVPDVEKQSRAPGQDILYVGRLDESKGVRLLLQAWTLREHRSGRLLRIAGDGPLRPMVDEAAAGDSSIVVLGPVPQRAISEEFSRAAAVALPSLSEGYPLVVAEARAHARAVVTVAGGALETIVTDETGWVCSPDPTSLSRALDDASGPESARRGRLARILYERENSPAAALNSLEAIYQRAIDVSAGRFSG